MNLERTQLPVIPLRGVAVMPGEVIHCDIGRKKSLSAVEKALENGGAALFCAQPDPSKLEVSAGDFASVGTVCRIRQIFRLKGENVRLLVSGQHRGRITAIVAEEPHFEAEVEAVEETDPSPSVQEALRRQVEEQFRRFDERAAHFSAERLQTILDEKDFGSFLDIIGAVAAKKLEDKQALLEQFSREERGIALLVLLQKELEVLAEEQRIADRVKESIGKKQREMILREQISAIREELGENGSSVADGYRQRMEEKQLPDAVREKLEKEIDRLASLPEGSHETAPAQAYIECILDLPWTEQSEDDLDLDHAREVLNKDHYGMDKVKDRILEMLAVQKLTGDPQGQILCLVGPPGVGKTSIASAIAEAMGRKFVRMSLGGVHDEAEIRGHRRTYIGARPGRVIEAMKTAGTVNPLLLFDEIDKLTGDVHGDPAAAMLEVLDSAQNNSFNDHFVELPYDLSRCLLMTTANDASAIPGPLRDRMEMLEVPGYLFTEKTEIARRHLLPRQMEKNGLHKTNLRVDDRCLQRLIEGYTREAGVRQMERVLGSICRKTACEVVEGKKRTTLSVSKITEWLGPVRHTPDEAEKAVQVGTVTGLAWTAAGGDTLQIEVSVMPGKGQLQLTGQLGDVMQESVRAALTYVRANAERFGIRNVDFDKTDIHVHVPEGAVPKDGPSAGITMMTALVSALSGRGVLPGIAMTGEITLRGRVLPIGGLREKLLAALRAGVHTVILPEKNRDSLTEVPEGIKSGLKLLLVRTADEVLRAALEPVPVCTEEPPAKQEAEAPEVLLTGEEDLHGTVCH